MTLHELPPLAVDDVDFKAMTEGQRAIVSAAFYGGAMAYLQIFDGVNPIANVIAAGATPGAHPDGFDEAFFAVLCRVVANGFASGREQVVDIVRTHTAAVSSAALREAPASIVVPASGDLH
ncbi:MAG TPA: hypothetical protein VHQ92_11020 [Pseudolabrys sp.]|jgi:hypothetical protein|nr:hypothetical protein [Pseudolabrys sp.]